MEPFLYWQNNWKGEILKTENNVYKKGYGEGNFDVNSKRQEKEVKLYFQTNGHLLSTMAQMA